MRVAKFTIKLAFEIVVPADGVEHDDIQGKDMEELKQGLLKQWREDLGDKGTMISADAEVTLADI